MTTLPFSKDGNGRMARLLASIPLVRHGFPPVSGALSQRADYCVAINNVCCVFFSPIISSDLLHPPRFRLTTTILIDRFMRGMREAIDLVQGSTVASTAG